MVIYRPPYSGQIDWAYDSDTQDRPFVYDAYEFNDKERGELTGTTRWMSLVPDPAHPPWEDDLIMPDLYERAVRGFGRVWFTFVVGARSGQPCRLLYLVATLTRIDGVALDPQARHAAEARVQDLGALRLIC